MAWNPRSNFIFPSNPGELVNPSFDAAQPLTACNLNQWNGAASTSFDQFSSYNFAPTTLEDSGFDSWKLMDTSYNPVQASSEDLAFDGSKLDTLEKGLCQRVKESGCEDPDSLCLEECIQGVPDSRVLGLDQVDENFMNSLSDEDIRAMLNTVEPSQQVVDSCNKPQPLLEDILTNFLNDPINNILYQNGTATKNGLDAFGISLLPEDLSINSSMMSQGSMALDSSTLVNPRGSITESSILVDDVAKAKIFEATALRELEAALSRINERTRICFRDACYRLAHEPSFNTSSRAYKVEPVEKETNVIDRAIVNLLFNPPCTEP